jgi:hypothetical protein
MLGTGHKQHLQHGHRPRRHWLGRKPMLGRILAGKVRIKRSARYACREEFPRSTRTGLASPLCPSGFAYNGREY